MVVDCIVQSTVQCTMALSLSLIRGGCYPDWVGLEILAVSDSLMLPVLRDQHSLSSMILARCVLSDLTGVSV